MTARTHWLVDYNTGVSSCGARGITIPAREGEQVTCKRCRKLIVAASKEEVHNTTLLAALLLSRRGAGLRLVR